MDEAEDNQILPRNRSARARVGAAFASAILPGLGQLMLRQFRSGALFCAILLAAASCLWPLRVGVSFHGYAVTVVAMLALAVVSSILALRSRAGGKRASWLWLLLSASIAFIGTSILAHVLMTAAGLHSYRIASSSMEPTVFVNDTIMTDLRAYKDRAPQRGDIVVFAHKDYTIIKRLIGLPGDRISGDHGVILRNGIKLDEPYAVHDKEDVSEEAQTFDEIVVPDGQLYLLGDNRNHSLDSRYQEFGHVYFSDVRGNVRYVVKSSHYRTGMQIK